MKKLFTVLSALILLLSCKKEGFEIATKNINVSDFNKLNMGSNFEVNVIKSSFFSVKAEGRLSDLGDLKFEVINGELKIWFTDILTKREKIKVNISMPSLHSFNFYGNSKVYINNFIEVNDIKGIINGSSKVAINASASKFQFNVSDNSELVVNGNAEWVKVFVSGNSFLNTYGIVAKNGEAVATDNSRIKIYANTSLNAATSGNSYIYFKGNPSGRFFAESDNSKIIEE